MPASASLRIEMNCVSANRKLPPVVDTPKADFQAEVGLFIQGSGSGTRRLPGGFGTWRKTLWHTEFR